SDRQIYPLLIGWLSRALADLRQPTTDMGPVLRASLQRAEQVKDLLPLSYAQAFLARWLADSKQQADWEEAKPLAILAFQSRNPNTVGLAHRALAQIALAQGELATAEAEARATCQFQSMFPPHKAEPAAFLARVLHARGKDAEALQVCEEAVQEQELLG